VEQFNTDNIFPPYFCLLCIDQRTLSHTTLRTEETVIKFEVSAVVCHWMINVFLANSETKAEALSSMLNNTTEHVHWWYYSLVFFHRLLLQWPLHILYCCCTGICNVTAAGKAKLTKKSRKKLKQEDDEMNKHDAVSVLICIACFKVSNTMFVINYLENVYMALTNGQVTKCQSY